MAKDKTRKTRSRRPPPKRRRVTMWLDIEIADKLTLYAAHKKCDQGRPVEDLLRPFLAKFYVVDSTVAAESPQLGVVEGTSEPEGERAAS